MAYEIHIKMDKRDNYHSPAEAKTYYGRYSREGICVHWWNSPDKVKDSDHDNIVNYIYNKGTSIHYVVSNGKITKMVEPDNVAWHAEKGNPITIGIEFSPHLNDEGYKRGGWLISELEKKYGRTLKLYKHSDFVSTSCPGTISLTRLRQEADRFKQAPPTSGGSGGTEMAASADIVTKIYRAVLLREPDPGGLQTYTGRPVDSVFNAIYNSPEANAVRQREQAEDARRNELEGLVRDLQAKMSALEQATGAERKKLADEVAKLTKDVTEAEAAHKQEVDRLTEQINSLKDQTCEQPVAKKLTVSDHIRGIIEAAVAWFNKK